jgi:hypothetical protein
MMATVRDFTVCDCCGRAWTHCLCDESCENRSVEVQGEPDADTDHVYDDAEIERRNQDGPPLGGNGG